MAQEFFTIDTGYFISDDGDVVTPDGKPRQICLEHIQAAEQKAAKAGKPVGYRAMTATERKWWDGQDDFIARQLRAFPNGTKH